MSETQGDFFNALHHPDEKPKRTPFQEGMKRSADSANYRWSDDEKAQVDAAILVVSLELAEFTSSDVWKRIPGVPVTKGMASRLNMAVRQGLIENTGRTAICKRGGQHDHAQRLSIWRIL